MSVGRSAERAGKSLVTLARGDPRRVDLARRISNPREIGDISEERLDLRPRRKMCPESKALELPTRSLRDAEFLRQFALRAVVQHEHSERRKVSAGGVAADDQSRRS